MENHENTCISCFLEIKTGIPWGLPGVSPRGLPGGPLGVSLSSWLPDVSQMPPSCFLDASQMPPRWLQDDSQMLPDVSRCLPDDSRCLQMPPDDSWMSPHPPGCSPKWSQPSNVIDNQAITQRQVISAKWSQPSDVIQGIPAK